MAKNIQVTGIPPFSGEVFFRMSLGHSAMVELARNTPMGPGRITAALRHAAYTIHAC